MYIYIYIGLAREVIPNPVTVYFVSALLQLPCQGVQAPGTAAARAADRASRRPGDQRCHTRRNGELK